jgi:hypothetical protein
MLEVVMSEERLRRNPRAQKLQVVADLVNGTELRSGHILEAQHVGGRIVVRAIKPQPLAKK